MIRKLRKGQWSYRCATCDYDSPVGVDLFSAQLSEQRHKTTPVHALNAITDIVQPVVQMYAKMATTIIEQVKPAMDQLAYALAPPANVPHDPSLRSDKRKWGGK